METIMQHISKTLGKLPADVKQLNLYKKGQITPGKIPLDYCSITSLYEQLKTSAGFADRLKEVEKFNQVI